LLGWFRTEALDGLTHDFYIRQLWDWKVSLDIGAMDEATLNLYAKLCAWTLARAHAVSGDAVAISAYLGDSDRFERSLAEFAVAYAEQNQRDFETVTAAASAGRL
jgi:hypothetical protein